VNFLNYEISTQAGDLIQVFLTGNAAWVRVLDEANFQRYRSGVQYQYYGGHYTHSPASITAPGAGRWHVVVDLGGMAGHVNAAVQVLQPSNR
jgi:uncharacterized protein DUF1883